MKVGVEDEADGLSSLGNTVRNVCSFTRVYVPATVSDVCSLVHVCAACTGGGVA